MKQRRKLEMLRVSIVIDACYSIPIKPVQNKKNEKMCKLITILIGLCLIRGTFGNLTDFVDLDAIKSESEALRMNFDQFSTGKSDFLFQIRK